MAEETAPDWVTLVSSDGFEFIIQREPAIVAGTIRRMLDPKNGFKESVTKTCHFENIPGVVLEQVCEYLYYSDRYKDMTSVPDMDIPPELSLELALAADFLEC